MQAFLLGAVISCKIKLAMEWVSVKDKMPDDNGFGESDYLALWVNDLENPYWTQGRYDFVKQRWHSIEREVEDSVEYDILINITHWMIIPELSA